MIFSKIKVFKIVKDTISEVKQTYTTNKNKDNTDAEHIKFNINDQLFLETLMIRGNTIKYSSYKKKQQLEEERKLEQEIKILENEINRNFLNMTEEALHTLETKKSILNDIQKEKIEGMMLRSRSRYEDLGEKPTQYFFNLEKRNYTSKVIHKLVNTEGEEFTNTADILKCQTNFYKDLYKQCDHKDNITIQSERPDLRQPGMGVSQTVVRSTYNRYFFNYLDPVIPTVSDTLRVSTITKVFKTHRVTVV